MALGNVFAADANPFEVVMKTTVLVFSLLLLTAKSLLAQTNFFDGKTAKIVAGFGAGSVDDAWSRLLARYMGKYIPGNPSFIVQNMPGAGAMIAANYVYGVAKPDGLTLAGLRAGLYFDQLVKRKQVQFDWRKFTWLGSPSQPHQLIYMRANTPYKTIADVRRAAEPPKCGASGTASTGHYLTSLMEHTVGAKFISITGYKDGPEVDLAVEREEIHCRGISLETGFAREPLSGWIKSGYVRVLMQTGKKRDARLPDTPTIYELMDEYKTPESARRLATVILAVALFGRPYVSSPGLLPERAKTLQSAFMKATADPELVAETKRRQLELNPISGEDLAALAQEVIAQPPEVIERMKQVLGN
jgi:tripartite-type tricarboxylate transporter receptor subunit TctC